MIMLKDGKDYMIYFNGEWKKLESSELLESPKLEELRKENEKLKAENEMLKSQYLEIIQFCKEKFTQGFANFKLNSTHLVHANRMYSSMMGDFGHILKILGGKSND